MILSVYWSWGDGRSREMEVRPLGAGVGEIDCLECGGDGDWKKFLALEQVECLCPGDTPYPCVQCKGTGKQLITVCPSLGHSESG